MRISLTGELTDGALFGAAPFTYYDDRAFGVRDIQPTGGPAAGGTEIAISVLDARLLVDLGGVVSDVVSDGDRPAASSSPADRTGGGGTSGGKATAGFLCRFTFVPAALAAPGAEASDAGARHVVVAATVVAGSTWRRRAGRARWSMYHDHGHEQVQGLSHLESDRLLICRVPPLPPLRASVAAADDSSPDGPVIDVRSRDRAEGTNRERASSPENHVSYCAVEVSVNGQDFSSSRHERPGYLERLGSPSAYNSFAYYDEAAWMVADFAPRAGPPGGGTVVTVVIRRGRRSPKVRYGTGTAGFDEADGDEPPDEPLEDLGGVLCLFGELSPPVAGAIAHENKTSRVSCVSPPHWSQRASSAPTEPLAVVLSVSINGGRDYLRTRTVPAVADTFTYYDFAGPMSGLRVGSISPSGGPRHGGTLVRVNGAGFSMALRFVRMPWPRTAELSTAHPPHLPHMATHSPYVPHIKRALDRTHRTARPAPAHPQRLTDRCRPQHTLSAPTVGIALCSVGLPRYLGKRRRTYLRV